jgi:hypothetical protein
MLKMNSIFHPKQSDHSPNILSRWMALAAGILFFLGSSSCAVGIYSIIMIVYDISAGLSDYNFPMDNYAGVLLYLGPGVAWLLSGTLLWKARPYSALSTALVGIIIPIILFAIMGF